MIVNKILKSCFVFLYPTIIYLAFTAIATFLYWLHYAHFSMGDESFYFLDLSSSLEGQGVFSILDDYREFNVDPDVSLLFGLIFNVNLLVMLYLWGGSVWVALLLAGKKPIFSGCAKDCIYAFSLSYLVLLLMALLVLPLFEFREPVLYVVFLMFVVVMMIGTMRRYSLGMAAATLCVLVPWSVIVFLSKFIFDSGVFEDSQNNIWFSAFNFLLLLVLTS